LNLQDWHQFAERMCCFRELVLRIVDGNEQVVDFHQLHFGDPGIFAFAQGLISQFFGSNEVLSIELIFCKLKAGLAAFWCLGRGCKVSCQIKKAYSNSQCKGQQTNQICYLRESVGFSGHI